MMEDKGMPLAYHHHMGTVIETQKDTERLMDNTIDEVKLLIDTGHMLFAGGDSIKIIKDFHQKLIHVHTKDIRKEMFLKNQFKMIFLLEKLFLRVHSLYQEMDVLIMFLLLKLLKEKNYSGWIVVEAEQDPVKANPLEYAKKGFSYFIKF